MKKGVRTYITGIAISAFLPGAFALDGANVLLNNVADDKEEVQKETSLTSAQNVFEGFKLKDPFAIQAFSDWRSAGKLEYEVNAWYLKLLQGKYEEAAHLLNVMKNKMPNELYASYRASEIYLFHKLGLNQRFFDTWVDFISNDKLFKSKAGMTLSQYIDMHSLKFFGENVIQITQEQRQIILDKVEMVTPFFTFAKAAIYLRKGEDAYQSMVNIPAGHELKMPLIKTVLLAKARKNELAEAGKIIKKYLEPEIEKIKDPIVLGDYYINLARFLYQAGALDAAENFYLKVPNKHNQFTQARAELMWIYLRTNNTAKLRGQIASLKSTLFENYFIPEIYVVRSISNLKLCQYEEINNDFEDFVTANKKWAQIIKENLENEEVFESQVLSDYFYNRAEKRIATIKAEIDLTEKLAKRSVKAALPAIGVQPHWEKSINVLNKHLVQAQKQRLLEFKRPWKNREKILAEAIKKMKFVKIEAMTQMRNLIRKNASLGEGNEASEPIMSKDSLVFPYDGALWQDEVLNLQAKAKSYCLKRGEL